jgi:hypothetical protein
MGDKSLLGIFAGKPLTQNILHTLRSRKPNEQQSRNIRTFPFSIFAQRIS